MAIYKFISSYLPFIFHHPWGTFDWYITNPPDLKIFHECLFPIWAGVQKAGHSQYLVMVGKVFHPSELLPLKWWWKEYNYFFCLMIPSESFISSFWKNLFCCLVTGFFVVPSRLFKTAVKGVLFTWENGNTFPCCSSVPLWVVGILRHKTRTWVWYTWAAPTPDLIISQFWSLSWKTATGAVEEVWWWWLWGTFWPAPASDQFFCLVLGVIGHWQFYFTQVDCKSICGWSPFSISVRVGLPGLVPWWWHCLWQVCNG